jgi:hypothetical protein
MLLLNTSCQWIKLLGGNTKILAFDQDRIHYRNKWNIQSDKWSDTIRFGFMIDRSAHCLLYIKAKSLILVTGLRIPGKPMILSLTGKGWHYRLGFILQPFGRKIEIVPHQLLYFYHLQNRIVVKFIPCNIKPSTGALRNYYISAGESSKHFIVILQLDDSRPDLVKA